LIRSAKIRKNNAESLITFRRRIYVATDFNPPLQSCNPPFKPVITPLCREITKPAKAIRQMDAFSNLAADCEEAHGNVYYFFWMLQLTFAFCRLLKRARCSY